MSDFHDRPARPLGPPLQGWEFNIDEDAEVIVNGKQQLLLVPGDVLVVRERNAKPRKCPDDGTCHHLCARWQCFRVACCEPLSGVYPNDEWPAITVGIFGTMVLTESMYAINAPVNYWDSPVHPAIPWAVIGFLTSYGQSRVVPR